MLEKRVAYATSTGTQLQETAYEQCIELPRAIATSDGNRTKGTKSNTTKAFEKRIDQMKCTYFLMIQNVRCKVQNTLKDSVRIRS